MAMAMAGLLSLDQAQMVGLMVVYVCVVVLWQWKSGLCCLCSCCWVVVLWQWLWIVPFVVFYLVVVCIILLEWIYYFIVMFIIFYCVKS